MTRVPFLIGRAANTPDPCTDERCTVMSGLAACCVTMARRPPERRWTDDAGSSQIQNPRTDSQISLLAAAAARAWAADRVCARAVHRPDRDDSNTETSRRRSG